jgi:membrane protein DedA with SNARE-associated domain
MKGLARWHIDGGAIWSAIFVALVAFGGQLVAYIWIQHWQQGFNAVTTLMLLTSVVIGVLVAALERFREQARRRP